MKLYAYRFSSTLRAFVSLAAAIVFMLTGCLAHARRSRGDKHVVFPAEPQTLPAVRYAQLDKEACQMELEKRGISWKPANETRGVETPVRLTGPLHGVTFRSGLPPKQREISTREIMDCRLVLSLYDFAKILAGHNVKEVVYMSSYRPPGKRWKPGPKGSRHHFGLAVDISGFVRDDGTELNVKKDFGRRRGTTTCGPKAHQPSSSKAKTLRAIVCEAAEKERLFNVALTPYYNYAHHDHFHFHIQPPAQPAPSQPPAQPKSGPPNAWFLVR